MKKEIKNTINNMWLAGLGVASFAQKESAKVYDSLIKEGKTFEKKSKETVQEVSDKAEEKISTVRKIADKQIAKVENLFETRIESVLNKLDIPSSQDISGLSKKVDSLVKEIKKIDTKKVA